MVTENYAKYPHYPMPGDCRLTDDFFAPFIYKIETVSAPDIFRKFMKDGAIENYERVARGDKGGHAGPPWYHGLICECIRGVSDIISMKYDASLDAELDEIIDAIDRAQSADEEGYINPYTTLERPTMRWGLNGGNIRWQHETYDAGCLIEAGVHHYRATGKTKLLKCAVKMANYLAREVGDEPKYNIVCEHSMCEQSLISLEVLLEQKPELLELTGAVPGEYNRVALYFINHKGDHKNRHMFPPFLREYAQDHCPTCMQREAVGHAVRATLFYHGIAEAAAANDDSVLKETADAIWKDIADTKFHINGAVGAYRNEESFGQQYELPNDAYLETCAGVGLAFFGASEFRINPGAHVWDTVEITLTNMMPAAVSEDGVHYTYENPLETRGGMERWSWHGCPCCPPMLLKLAGEMPSYIWAAKGNDIWLNMFIDNETVLDGNTLTLSNGKITVPADTRLHIRIPEWAQNFEIYSDGKKVSYTTENGYAVVCGGEFEVKMDKTITKVMAHPFASSDTGRVAVLYGPVLYCCEKAVDKWEDLDFEMGDEAPVMNSDGTITVKSTDGREFTLIEYRRWNNHGPLPMRIWFRQKGVAESPYQNLNDVSAWDGKLYMPFARY